MDYAKVAALALSLTATPAEAFLQPESGAQFLQRSQSSQMGYVSAVTDIVFGGNNGILTERLARHQAECIVTAKINLGQLVEATGRFIQTNPKALPRPAWMAVVSAIGEICGRPN